MQIFQNFFLYLFPRVILHSEWEIGHSYTTETPSVVTPGTGSSSIVGLNDLWPLMLMPVWQGKYYKPGSGLKKKKKSAHFDRFTTVYTTRLLNQMLQRIIIINFFN